MGCFKKWWAEIITIHFLESLHGIASLIIDLHWKPWAVLGHTEHQSCHHRCHHQHHHPHHPCCRCWRCPRHCWLCLGVWPWQLAHFQTVKGMGSVGKNIIRMIGNKKKNVFWGKWIGENILFIMKTVTGCILLKVSYDCDTSCKIRMKILQKQCNCNV